MKVYAGIDLHSTNSVLTVIDETGQLHHEKRYPNELPVIIAALVPYREELVGVVVESTYNWYWLVDGLMAAGFPARLAHAAGVPQYAGLKHGDDFTDARHLAELSGGCRRRLIVAQPTLSRPLERIARRCGCLP